MRTTITKTVGGITDRYWGRIIYDAQNDVTQIQLMTLRGQRDESQKVIFHMDGEEGVELIKAIARELK